MSKSYTKAEARRIIIERLDALLRERVAGREDRGVTHEIARFKDRLEKDVRSLVGNRDYAVKGRAQ